MPFGGLLTLGIIGAGTSLIGGAIGSSAAGNAAEQEQAGAQKAIGTVTDASNKALGTASDVYGQQQSELAPYLAAGAQGLNSLTTALAPGGSLATAPSLDLGQFSFNPGDLTQDPGYQFQLQQGQAAVDRNAAATGTLGGNAAEALNSFGQGLAGTTYTNAFNRALQGYQANTGSQVANYNAALGSQNSIYQRLTGLTGIGQNATNTDVAAGTNYANNVTSNVLGTGANIAQLQTGAANAAAAGTIGQANAWSNALGGLGSTASTYGLLKGLQPTAGGGGTATPAATDSSYWG